MTDLPPLKLTFPEDSVAMRRPRSVSVTPVVDLPDVRLKTLVAFPANVNGGTGIEVTRDDGTYTLGLDYSEVATLSEIPAPVVATTFLLLWESTQGVYSRISLVDLKAALASIP